MGITDQYKTKVEKELETSQTWVQLASIASLATLRIGQHYNPKPAETKRSSHWSKPDKVDRGWGAGLKSPQNPRPEEVAAL